jgi:uncharacterized protein involved in exopolysaccharide biosynthesis
MIDERVQGGEAGRSAGAAARAGSAAPGRSAIDLPATVWRRKGLIVVTMLVSTAALVLGASLVKPRFLATAQIYIDSRGLQVVKTDITANSADAVAFTNFMESQALLITSDKVMELAVTSRPSAAAEPLVRSDEFAGSAAVAAGAAPKAIEAATWAAIETLKKQTSVRRPERTSIIEVTVTGAGAQSAADAANALAQGYQAMVAANQKQLAERATAQLSEGSTALATKIQTADAALQKFRASHNLVGSKDSLTSEAQLADVNARLGSARGKTAEAQAHFDQILAAKRSPEILSALPEALGSATLGSLRVQDIEARRQLASLTAVLGPQHPGVRAAQAQVSNTQSAVAAELGRISASAKGDLERAQQAEITITKTLGELKSRVALAGSDAIELRSLEQEVEAARAVYQQFLNRSRETDPLANLDTTNITIASAAQPPNFRAFPPRLAVLIGLGGGLGLALGLGLAVLLDMRRTPPRTPSSVGPPVPVALPVDRPPAAIEAPTPAPNFAVLAPFLATRAGPTLTGAVDLRTIGVPLLQPGEAGHQRFVAGIIAEVTRLGLRCLIVAGQNGGLERTALAVNLALAARSRGIKVMLIDKDAPGRVLTRAVLTVRGDALSPDAGRGLRKLYQDTANGVGLILPPPDAPVARVDPAELLDAVFGGGNGESLLICDGPTELAGLADLFAGDRPPGLVLTVTESEFRAGLERLADAAFAPHVVGIAAVARQERAAA